MTEALTFKDKWPNFTRRELSCNCRKCGNEYYHAPDFLDKLQLARELVGRPFRINSAHRCRFKNALVGGAVFSQHLKLAVDIDLGGHDPLELLNALVKAGFRGFGFYNTFLHVDLGRARHWYGDERAKAKWQSFQKS